MRPVSLAAKPYFLYLCAPRQVLHSLTLRLYYFRHKRFFVFPQLLTLEEIPFSTIKQGPGEYVFTFPGALHMVSNEGFNVAEAMNFVTKAWAKNHVKTIEIIEANLVQTENPSRTTGADLVPSRTISRTQGRDGSGTKKNPSRTRGANLVPKGRRQCGPYIIGLCYSKIHHSYLRYTTGCTSSWSLELLEPADKIGSERKKPENYKKQKIADQKGNCLFQEGNCRQLPFWTCFSIELPF